MTTDVSVVTGCYGHDRYLKHLGSVIESVRSQTFANLEHIVVADVRAEQLIKEKYSHPRLRVFPINNPDHIEAFNIGIAASRSEYAMCLGADDLISPTYVEKLIHNIDASSKYAISQSDLQEFGLRNGSWTGPAQYSHRALIDGNIIIGTSIFTKCLWEEVGGFEVGLFGFEDWNFWLACSKLNPSVSHVRERLLQYRIHDGVSAQCSPHDRLLRAMIRHEEQWYASYERLRVAIAKDLPKETLVNYALESYAMLPSRAEPLWELAVWLRQHDRIKEAYPFALAAASIPRPVHDGFLFLNEDVYRWKAIDEMAVASYWTGRFEEALEANEHLLKVVLDSDLDPSGTRAVDRIRCNLSACVAALPQQKAAE